MVKCTEYPDDRMFCLFRISACRFYLTLNGIVEITNMLPVDLHIMRPVYNITTPVKYVFALQQDTMHRYYEHI